MEDWQVWPVLHRKSVLPNECSDDNAVRSRHLVFQRDYQTEVLKRRFRLNLGFVSSASVDDLTELDVPVVSPDRPKHVDLPRWRFLQFVEARSNHSRAIFARLNLDVGACARQCAREINLNH